MDIAPDLYLASARKCRSVRDALDNDRWIIDLREGVTDQIFSQFLELFERVEGTVLTDDRDDAIIWKLTTNGTYSAKSACIAQFAGLIRTPFDRLIWKTWALEKCRFFGWLFIQNKIQTANLLERRGIPNDK